MGWVFRRVVSPICASAALATIAVSWATAAAAAFEFAQLGDDPAGVTAPAETPLERYSAFAEMAGQIEDQLSRGLERLPGGPIEGLVGEGGFITDHAEMLRASRATIEAGESIAEARRAGHVRAVLAFLDRATRLTRLVNRLENAETNGESASAAELRREITELSGDRLFRALSAGAPARLVVTAEEPGGETVYWPHAIHRIAVAVENRGDAPASGVAALIEPMGSAIADVSPDQGSCAAEIAAATDPGVSWRCRRGDLAPGERWQLGVAFRHAVPDGVGPGPAEEVRARVTASAKAPAIEDATVDVAFAVANCSANYHQSLIAMRDEEARRLLERMKEVRAGEPGLPRRWVSQAVRWPDEGADELMRRAGRIVSAAGADPWLSAQAGDGEVSRVVYGLRGYVKQNLYPALCTGTGVVVGSYRAFLDEFDSRHRAAGADAEHARALASRAIDRLVALQGIVEETGGEEEATSEETPDVAVEAEGEAAVPPPGPPTLDEVIGRFAALAGTAPATPDDGNGEAKRRDFSAIRQLADLPLAELAANEQALTAAREALAFIEAAFYFEAALSRYDALARAFDDVLAGIANASAAQCRCRSGAYAIAPTTAAVPVAGFPEIRPMPSPRPKPTR